MSTLTFINVLAGLIVLAEGLNKCQRADLFDGKDGWVHRVGGFFQLITPWRWKRERVAEAIETLGWMALSIGGAGAIAQPLLKLEAPSVQSVAVIGGIALMIIRSRLTEEKSCEAKSSPAS